MEVFFAAFEPLSGVLLALALGLLIGVERGWSHRDDAKGTRVAGIRTFGLLGLAGGLAAQVGRAVSPWLTVLIVAGAAIAVLIGYLRESKKADRLSATTTIVAMITLGIGLLAAAGQGVLASVAAALTTLVLASRRQLHGLIGQMSEGEVQAVARFALISLAILPLLPDHAYGPYEAWNPRQLWMVVVLVSGISLAGYIATRWLGPSRGTIATAAAGAVVSSTAVTASLANRLRKGEESEPILIAGIAVATAVMVMRVLILVAILAHFALPSLAILVAPAAVFNLAYTGWLLWRAKGATVPAGAMAVRNPFDIVPALLLAGLVMILSVIARWMLHQFGDGGLATALAISGMVDVDSAIITMSGLPPGTVAGDVAGVILAAPVLLNNLVKACIAIGIGGRTAGWRAAVPLLLTVVIGLLGLPFIDWEIFQKL